MIIRINALESSHCNSKASISKAAAGLGFAEVYWEMGPTSI
jgi:hypothetical protein